MHSFQKKSKYQIYEPISENKRPTVALVSIEMAFPVIVKSMVVGVARILDMSSPSDTAV